MRKDFEKLIGMHRVQVKKISYSDSYSGDFFDESTSATESSSNIYISIQGTPDAIERLKRGISIPKGMLHCYAEHDVTISETDLIEISDKRFKINNLSDAIKNGSVVFKEFDLEYVDKGDSY
jgi:hypothetical protein